MKLVHTADWHLGQSFGPFSRDLEHGRFLAWLLDTLEEESADALLICGDIFDQGNPPSSALARYYDFLAAARRRLPALDIVVIGGNHDAPARLDAPGPVLQQLGVHVTGSLPRIENAGVDASRCLVPLHGPSGETEALCAAVPFLRMADLSLLRAPGDGSGDPVTDAVTTAYATVIDAALATRENGQALIALGHCQMAGARQTEESERPLWGARGAGATAHRFGDAHALPLDIFPAELAYTALGHLHFAQSAGRDDVRYSGSPIPLSMTERGYRHQVLVVELEGERLGVVTPREVPRAVELWRLPEEAAPLDAVLDRLRSLDAPARPEAEQPFLEVRVRLDKPAPDLRAQVEQALEGKAVRLLRVQRDLAGAGGPLADRVEAAALAELEPGLVLERLYQRTFGGAVPPDIAAAFDELVDVVRGVPGASETRPPHAAEEA